MKLEAKLLSKLKVKLRLWLISWEYVWLELLTLQSLLLRFIGLLIMVGLKALTVLLDWEVLPV
jgi:hypothetical protein